MSNNKLSIFNLGPKIYSSLSLGYGYTYHGKINSSYIWLTCFRRSKEVSSDRAQNPGHLVHDELGVVTCHQIRIPYFKQPRFHGSCHGLRLPKWKGITTSKPQVLPVPCSKRYSFVWRIAHWKIHTVHLDWRCCEIDPKNNISWSCNTPLKFSMEPEISPWKRRFLLETMIFRFHVKLQGCILSAGP